MVAFAFTGRLEFLWLVTGGMAYVYYFVLRLRKGVPRLLALLPLLPPFLLVPWRPASAMERSLLSFLFLWMMTSKLLMLVWDTGPAADPSVVSSFPRFLSTMTLSMHLRRDEPLRKRSLRSDGERTTSSEPENSDPLDRTPRHSQVSDGVRRRKTEDDNSSSEGTKPEDALDEKRRNVVRRRRREDGEKNGDDSLTGGTEPEASLVDGNALHSSGSSHWTVGSLGERMAESQDWRIVMLRCVFYFILAGLMVHTILVSKGDMPRYIEELTYVLLVYISCLFVFEVAGVVPAVLLGVQLQPQFNMPFLADSLADFWGRRWNLLVNNLLRASVYEPMLAFLSKRGDAAKERKRNRALSTASTFLVSALMHELIFFYINQTKPTWEVTIFFVLNGVATIVEGALIRKPGGGQRSRVPRLLRRVYTLSFVFFTACWFFFPPLIRTGSVDRNLAELQKFIGWVQHTVVRTFVPLPLRLSSVPASS